MGGNNNFLTQEMDIYAFAICCVEILDKGAMPWQHQDDDAVVRFVLGNSCLVILSSYLYLTTYFEVENKRPNLPHTRASSPVFTALINACWAQDPAARPSFKQIAIELKQLRERSGSHIEEVDSPRLRAESWVESEPTRPSPDMRPIPLPNSTCKRIVLLSCFFSDDSVAMIDPGFIFRNSPSSEGSFQTAAGDMSTSPGQSTFQPRLRTPDSSEIKMPEPVIYTPSVNTSQASSIFDSSGRSLSSILEDVVPEYDGYESPPPANDRIAEIRNERRYRLLLAHEFHPSRKLPISSFFDTLTFQGLVTLPLWTPDVVLLGAVGYLEKPSGAFITLFNSFDPPKSSNGALSLPSLYGYGRINRGEQRQDKRSAAMRGLDALAGLLQFKAYSYVTMIIAT